MEGILVVTALKCKLTRDTETFGKMDPYVLFKVKDQKAMTQVKIDAGKECEWNETFTFHVHKKNKNSFFIKKIISINDIFDLLIFQNVIKNVDPTDNFMLFKNPINNKTIGVRR